LKFLQRRKETNAQSRKIRKLIAVREAQGQHEAEPASAPKPHHGHFTPPGKEARRQGLTGAEKR
jgi:hypothetical protein